ncbi:MAG: hypothetical protein HY665_02690 [Chloroflexi bacterium]|nr:hypothetical protein [Chloroflexota bacterium]
MTTKDKAGKVSSVHKLDSKAYAEKVRLAGRLADKALQRYGEPTMSLADLRVVVGRKLRGASLSDLIIKEREAGW